MTFHSSKYRMTPRARPRRHIQLMCFLPLRGGRLQHQQKESLQDFAQSVRRLTDNAYPGMAEELRNRIARDHFMSNIRESEIRSTVHLSRPKSMEAALQTAVEMEAFPASKKLREPPKLVRCVASSAEHEKG